MFRREALRRVSWMMGGALSAPTITAFLQACETKKATSEAGAALQFLTEDENELVMEISELIIPTTDTPGAKAAKVNEFIDLMLADCYPEKDQKSFKAGLVTVEDESKKTYDNAFLECNEEEKVAILKKMEAMAQQKAKPEVAEPEDPETGASRPSADQSGRIQSGDNVVEEKPESGIPFFRLMKELTMLGYFTSEIGATQALRYIAVPGSFDGCKPLEPGEKAWAT